MSHEKARPIPDIPALTRLPNKPIPVDARRIVLVNPTRYLGNLLLAGGLIQQYARQCLAANQELLLVLDDAFEDLCGAAFADARVLYYPRRGIASASGWRKPLYFARFVKQLRAFAADLAFNIEEDATTNRLTQLSGAAFKLGCSPARHRFAYQHVANIDYAGRHRWESFLQIFQAAGLRQATKSYINLQINQASIPLIERLPKEIGFGEHPLVAVHSGATKDYKKWPESSFIKLCSLLIENKIQPLLIGAGAEDAARCQRIMAALPVEGRIQAVNLCNQLSLAELAQLFTFCSGIVGNDSGPFHLAAAQGLPGVVIFGPTDAAIWSPLTASSRLLQRKEACDPQCSRRACHASPEYRCLREISPEEVIDNLCEVSGVR